MSSLRIGYCGIDETQILEKDHKGRLLPNSNYTEIVLAFSNGMVGRHAICANCASNLTDEKIDQLTERIKGTWSDQLAGSGTKAQFDKLKEVKTLTYGTQREDVVKRHEQKMEEERAKKLKPKK